jgi:hypothetical protein
MVMSNNQLVDESVVASTSQASNLPSYEKTMTSTQRRRLMRSPKQPTRSRNQDPINKEATDPSVPIVITTSPPEDDIEQDFPVDLAMSSTTVSTPSYQEYQQSQQLTVPSTSVNTSSSFGQNVFQSSSTSFSSSIISPGSCLNLISSSIPLNLMSHDDNSSKDDIIEQHH